MIRLTDKTYNDLNFMPEIMGRAHDKLSFENHIKFMEKKNTYNEFLTEYRRELEKTLRETNGHRKTIENDSYIPQRQIQFAENLQTLIAKLEVALFIDQDKYTHVNGDSGDQKYWKMEMKGRYSVLFDVFIELNHCRRHAEFKQTQSPITLPQNQQYIWKLDSLKNMENILEQYNFVMDTIDKIKVGHSKNFVSYN
ncbi:hypothetical protein ACFL1H_03930 [Nanoarchaeota archaeon]